ncbi:hypothetical protein APA_4726 [Pseudanabaena sp. lw0831]|uniref:DUF192 domain-containing protein n=1 Tax=Pseudanabaena sp. lw0831 TaxID=1357935 RepID=UPI001A3527E7|nr:DUF192 domain-containing protein [Pseudanabaena sp. lw0831]GBO56390.1 hypothetical protein APA_4726 [Pseudanabaena sp. lw0831]
MTGNMTGDTFRNCDTPNHSSIQTLCIKLCTVSLSLCLMGCAPVSNDSAKIPTAPTIPATSSPQPITPQTKPKPVSELAQYLPITATATISGREIQLEVANTFQEQEKGLMFRPPLADDLGMLFIFTPARPVAFWMKNTPSPLDIIFLLDGEVKAIARNATTCKSDPCPVYPEGGVVADNVLEVRAGLTQEIGLKEGDRISVKFLLPKNQ